MLHLVKWDVLKILEPYKEQLKPKCLINLVTSSLDPKDIVRAMEHPQVEELIEKPLDRYKIRELHENMRS